MIRVHIAHDNVLLRDSLAVALAREPDLEIVEVSPEGAAGLKAVDDRRADVLVLWVPWRTRPFAEISRYREQAPTMRILCLCTHPTVRKEMIDAGADAVVDEEAGLGPLLGTIRAIGRI